MVENKVVTLPTLATDVQRIVRLDSVSGVDVDVEWK